MYSGYLSVSGSTRHLHYMFIESQRHPPSDPVVLWFNGGPGCSTMMAVTQEHGPYVVFDGDTYFSFNEWSWNKEANMIYVESPAGIGYSYCLDDFNCNI